MGLQEFKISGASNSSQELYKIKAIMREQEYMTIYKVSSGSFYSSVLAPLSSECWEVQDQGTRLMTFWWGPFSWFISGNFLLCSFVVEGAMTTYKKIIWNADIERSAEIFITGIFIKWKKKKSKEPKYSTTGEWLNNLQWNHCCFIAQSLSHVLLFVTPWTAAHQVPHPSLSPRVCSKSGNIQCTNT